LIQIGVKQWYQNLLEARFFGLDQQKGNPSHPVIPKRKSKEQRAKKEKKLTG
jgi:hypothetical protein